MLPLLMLILVVGPSFASPRLVRLPALEDVRLYEYTNEEGRYILTGRTILGAPYFLQIDGDGAKRIKAKERLSPRGGTEWNWDLGDERVFTGSPAYLLNPLRARDALTPRTLNERARSQLRQRVHFGLNEFSNESVVSNPVAPDGKLIQFVFKDPHAAEDLASQLPNHVARYHGALWTFAGDADAVERWATERNFVLTRRDHLAPEDLPAAPGSFVNSARTAWRDIEYLNAELTQVRVVADALGYWRNNEAAGAYLKRHFTEPLMVRIDQAYQRVRAFNSADAVDHFLLAGGTVGPRLSQLDQMASSAHGTYLTEWLSMLETRVYWIVRSMVYDARAITTQLKLDNLPRAIQLVDYLPPTSLPHLNLEIPTYPLRILGLRNSARTRAAVVSFIAAGDKAAEWQHLNLIDPADRHQLIANRAVVEVIRALPFGVRDHRADPGFPRVSFRPALYFTQAAQILSELLETSHVTLTNRATYLAVLDAAVNLQLQIASEFGANPSAGGHALERDRLTTEAHGLSRLVQTELLRRCDLFLE